MKTLATLVFFFIAIVSFSQETNSAIIKESVNEVETLEVASVNDWFAGVKYTASKSTPKSNVESKKEQYLKEGFSNKTLLVRKITKRAEMLSTATV